MANRLYKNKYRQDTLRLPDWDYGNDGFYFVTICTKNRVNYFGKIINGEMRLNEIGNIVYWEWQNTKNKRFNVALDEFVVMPNHIHGVVKINNRIIKTIFSEQSVVAAHCNAPLRHDFTNENKINHNTNGFAKKSVLNTAHCNAVNCDGCDNRVVAAHCNAPLRRCGDKLYIYDTIDCNPNYNLQYKNKFGPQTNNLSAIIRGFKGAATIKINEKFPEIKFSWQKRFHDRIIRNQDELDRIRKYIQDNQINWHNDRNK